MEVGGQSGIPARGAEPVAGAPVGRRRVGRIRPLSARDVQFYCICEDMTEALIYSMVVFGPWAFGTTQPWSIWAMNGAGYLLGAMLTCKLVIRLLKGYHPPRWDDAGLDSFGTPTPPNLPAARRLTAGLAWLTVAILGYCLVSAVNEYSTFHPEALGFVNRKHYIPWLPHSFDVSRTWLAFWTYLGLALSFWSIRDWLLGKSDSEERGQRGKPQRGGDNAGLLLPARLRRLLWVLALNGTLLGVEGIAQRLQGEGKLLFLVQARVNPGAESQFGPYAYRANASQYFNLLWPVCLGFWWMLNRSFSSRRK